MSLLNIVTDDQCAWVYFDTKGRSLDEPSLYAEWSKAIPLIHANTLLCCRGERLFLAHAFLNLFGTNRFADFDCIEAEFAEVLKISLSRYLDHAKQVGVDVQAMGQEMCLVGWSNKRNKPIFIDARRQPGKTTFEIKESWASIRPAMDKSMLDDLTSVPRMVRLARAQVQKFRAEALGEPIGGDLILAEITRAGMAFRKIASLA